MLLVLALSGCTGLPADSAPDSGEPMDSGDTAGDSGLGDGTHALSDAPAIFRGGAAYAAGNAVSFVSQSDGAFGVAISAYFVGRVCIFEGPVAPGDYALDDATTCWATGGTSSNDGSPLPANELSWLTWNWPIISAFDEWTVKSSFTTTSRICPDSSVNW